MELRVGKLLLFGVGKAESDAHFPVGFNPQQTVDSVLCGAGLHRQVVELGDILIAFGGSDGRISNPIGQGVDESTDGFDDGGHVIWLYVVVS